MGLRRPTRIKVQDSDVPLLSIQDFQLDVVGDDTFLPDCLVLHDLAVQRAVAETCMQLTKLCLCIGDVLTLQYAEQDGQTMRFSSDMQMFLPRSFNSKLSALEFCKDGLESWAAQLPESLRLGTAVSEMYASPLPASIVVHRGLLHMIYYATISTLHRPQVLQSVPTITLPSGGDEIQASRAQLRWAAKGTMEVAKMLIEHGFVSFLPMTGVTTLQSAVVNHLLDIKSTNETDRRNALQGFCYCIRAIYDLRDTYNTVEHTLALVEAAIRRADIRVPVVHLAASSDSPGVSITATGEFLTEKKATNIADLFQAGIFENLISPLLATPQLADLPAERSLLTKEMERDTQAAAQSASNPMQTSSSTSNFDLVPDYGLARKLDSLLTIPLPVPEQQEGMDYWSYAPASPLNFNMSVPYDFDLYFNCTPGAEQEPQLSEGSSASDVEMEAALEQLEDDTSSVVALDVEAAKKAVLGVEEEALQAALSAVPSMLGSAPGMVEVEA